MRKSVMVVALCMAAVCAAAVAQEKNVNDTGNARMLTAWGEALKPEAVWREYPRPQLRRPNWLNLNGYWDYRVTSAEAKAPGDWDGKILVPFALESTLSGVGKRFTPEQALWYRRTVAVDKKPGRRYLLNFEAVDYQSTVWVNGTEVGRHTGGNLPFTFDVTDGLQTGENTITLRVTDATDTAYQLHGKQRLNPKGIWYTPVSGIWQTVWLEDVPAVYVTGLRITPKTDGTVTIRVGANREDVGGVRVAATLEGKPVAAAEGSAGEDMKLCIPDPRLWTPDTPTLYDLEIRVGDDTVHSYVGLREVGRLRDAAGNWQFTLNGQPIFHWGTLDQGWWPDGLLTPPSDEAMRSDIAFLKAAGFNTIRKHIKVEPRRYYYHCDRLGMMMWQDQVSAQADNPKWTRLQPNPETRTWPEAAHKQFMAELKGMIDALYSHPCIVVWVPFNERWGQHQSMDVGRWVVDYDPTRLVNIASGGNFLPVGHVVDHHQYPHPGFPFELGAGGRFDDYIKVVGEFGGHGFPVQDHLWNPGARNWGYGGLPKDKAEWIERYKTSIAKLNELRERGISGGIYTQTTDVEGEINGLLTYDRKVQKIPADELAAISRRLFQPSRIETPPPAPADASMDIDAGLTAHNRALFIKEGWIRDPYIILGPDDYYYLTGTTPNPKDPREQSDPYNIGLGQTSIVGTTVQVWRGKELTDWEYLGTPFTLSDSWHKQPGNRVWAPELHWMGDRWALVHCPGNKANFALTRGAKLTGPWTHPMGPRLGPKHDPSLFKDSDGTWYMLWQNTLIAPLSKDLTRFTADPIRIDPAGSRTNAAGLVKSAIGHEGATMRKIGRKYVHFGTAWSTDEGRKGSYNLYYCTSDAITGPYGPRRFVGRFLGHGTPFQTRDGQWWCTAFFNANVPPLPRDGIRTRDLSEDAQTINQRGTTIVPLNVKILEDGDIYIRAVDPDYATPGPDEVQTFAP